MMKKYWRMGLIVCAIATIFLLADYLLLPEEGDFDGKLEPLYGNDRECAAVFSWKLCERPAYGKGIAVCSSSGINENNRPVLVQNISDKTACSTGYCDADGAYIPVEALEPASELMYEIGYENDMDAGQFIAASEEVSEQGELGAVSFSFVYSHKGIVFERELFRGTVIVYSDGRYEVYPEKIR
ncbi:MAG: hypothetical protein IIY11_00095 [Clostridia bacterium]|nr:hypothetical protein [Clostridia bacterium]MBQ2326165.1 hypothetical protein [Clostridia bacterium]